MNGPREIDEAASRLGRLALGVDGSVSAAADTAARERLLVALGSRRPRRAVLAVALAALAALLATAVVFLRVRPAIIEYSVVGPATARGEWLEVPADRGAVALRFSEGTEIELGPGSQGRVTELTPAGARVVLGGGALHARVVHRPQAKWVVAAGPYDIEVTGTAFEVDWSSGAKRLEVNLRDGSVIVRGPSLHDGVRLAAGQRLVAHAGTGSAELSSLFEGSAREPPPAPAVVAEPPPTASAEAPRAVASSAPTSWADLVSSGSFRAVLDAAAARGLETVLAQGSLRDLVALSDAARYAGDRALARRGLLAQRARFGSSAEARAAAFVLGRMADDAGSKGEALEWYDRYLGEAPRGAFAAEALGRRLVALVRLGRKEAARQAAEEYGKRFPRGAHAVYAREVLEGS